MSEPAEGAAHPGQRVLAMLHERRVSVTAAADALSCFRPTLSRFLHGHAALSTKMAKAIEACFGISAAELMHQQVAYDLEVSDD